MVVAIYVASFFIRASASPGSFVAVPEGEKAKTILSVLTELIKLITTLNTAILGAAAAITIKGKDWSSVWTYRDGLAIMATFVAVAVSYYGIYLSQVAILGMTYSGAISLEENRMWWAQQLQYNGTLFAIFLLGL